MVHWQILFVDDDEEDQELIRDALVSLNATDLAIFAENGKAALEILSDTHAADHHLPSLVVLDLNMPVMNGIQTLQALRQDERFKHLPVVIFSTSIHPVDMEECMQLGANNYVAKPVSLQENLHIVANFLSYCSDRV